MDAVKKARAAINRRRAQLSFDRKPKEVREKLAALGVSPYQEGVVIRRTCGTIRAK